MEQKIQDWMGEEMNLSLSRMRARRDRQRLVRQLLLTGSSRSVFQSDSHFFSINSKVQVESGNMFILMILSEGVFDIIGNSRLL